MSTARASAGTAALPFGFPNRAAAAGFFEGDGVGVPRPMPAAPGAAVASARGVPAPGVVTGTASGVDG